MSVMAVHSDWSGWYQDRDLDTVRRPTLRTHPDEWPLWSPPCDLPPAWMERAACHEHWDLFGASFEPGFGHASIARACKAICVKCPVRDDCLDYALEVVTIPPNDMGVFGGMTPKERRKERRRRAMEQGTDLVARVAAIGPAPTPEW